MKELCTKAILFFSINLLLGLVVIEIPERLHDWDNANTDSNLRVIPEGTEFDYLVLGTSRARVLSRGQGHALLEKELGGKTLNIARGGGGGIAPTALYYDWFLSRGNKAGVVIYAVDPFVFFSDLWNEERFFAEDEPLRFGFLLSMVQQSMGFPVILNYVQSKFTLARLQDRPHHTGKKGKHLERIDPGAVLKRLEVLYPSGCPDDSFSKYSGRFHSLVHRIAETSGELWMVFLPTLLGPEPGHERVAALCRRLEARHPNVHFMDFVDGMREPGFFYNHDHMNDDGTKEFAGRYLKPLLDK